jgi:hypothetical protein
MAAPVGVRPRSAVRVTVAPQLPPDAVARRDGDASEASAATAAARDEGMLARVRAPYDALVEPYLKALDRRPAPYLEVAHDGIREFVVLDETLWEQLFDLYLYHGWDAIARVDRGIRALFPRAAPPGSTWAPAIRFFDQTRALLGGLVRDALIELERASAVRMIGNLSVSAVAVDRAWARYGIRRTVRIAERPVGADAVVEEEVESFSFGEDARAEELVVALREAVLARAHYEAELQKVADVRAAVQRLRGTAQRFQQRGRPLSSDAQLAGELAIKDAQAKTLEDAATALYRTMLTVVNDQSPLALIALEGLVPKFERRDLEELLGAALWHLRGRLDKLGRQIDPDRGKVAALLTGTAAANLEGQSSVDAGPALVVPVDGPERAVIAAAMEGFGRDGGWFPMLHEGTLQQLAEAGDIPPDSWLYVVWNRYVVALGRTLAERRAQDEATTAFWSGFSKAAAAASLALLVTPFAKVGAALRGAVAIADLVLLAHTVSSVTGQLAQFEELRDKAVLGADAFSIEGLGRLGELGAYRERLVAGLSQQLLIELALIATGARWPVVKEALTLRGYVQDLEMLLTEG